MIHIKTFKKSIIAMLLAGGQGSRLGELTQNTAKPALPFGAKYRIIDFTLSNCVNSGIDTVGVLTQYQPLELNEYIGNGQPWDLDRYRGGVTILPPYQSGKGIEWYTGTANAIYKNINFINRYSPDNVIILSGDHIYRMDYSEMITRHKEQNADCTIAVIDVPLSEASRFGIMSVNESDEITEFAEKPKEPKSTLASMGVYVFRTEALLRYIVSDENDPESSKDFGKNIIPKMLSDGCKMIAYKFEGYWKDVGTPESFWSANMELLGEDPDFDLFSLDMPKILSRNEALPPQVIGKDSSIRNSVITEGCHIYGQVENSVIFSGATVSENACVRDSVILFNAFIGDGAIVTNAIVGSDSVIGKKAQIGRQAGIANELTVIGDRKIIKDNFTVTGTGGNGI